MKRAEVGRVFDRDRHGEWYCDVFSTPVDRWEAELPLSRRNVVDPVDGARYPTHAAALTAALEAVGLGKTEKEKR